MKISKSNLLNLSLVFTALGLGLMAVSTAERQLYLNIDNASHYMENVKLISSGYENSATLKQIGSGFVKIETPNFILSKTGFDEENYISTGFDSSILGGIKNRIEGELGEGLQVLANVIFGGSGNLINGYGYYNTYNIILGGESNKIESGANSVILGGKKNEIKGRLNVVLGFNNKIEDGTGSITVGNNSYVKGDYSAALGSGSKVEANNSFLRNDGSAETTLTGNNLFVIMAKSGMVINSGKAHNYAKLTLGGPLIISSKDSDTNIKCGEGEGGGILKMVDTDNQVCLCGCDGWSRNSMLGKGNCTKACNQDIAPVCGDIVTKEISELHYYFSGSCNSGKVVEGTGAYLVTRDDKVHRSCQTDDGQVVGCSGFANNGYGSCAGSHATGHGVILGNSNYIISLSPGVTTWHYDISQTPGICEWTCNINSGFTVNDAHDKCICNTGYQLSENGQSCELIPTPDPPDPTCTNTLIVYPNGGKIKVGALTTETAISTGQFCNTTINLIPLGKEPTTTTGNCTVSFYENKGTSTSPIIKTTIVTNTTNYSFDNWNNNAFCGPTDGTTYTFPGDNGIVCSKTANWKINNTTTSTGSITVPYVDNPPKMFLGWYTAADGGSKVIDAGVSSFTPNSCNQKLYAHWSDTTSNAECDTREPYLCAYSSNTVDKIDTISDNQWKWYCIGEGGETSPLCTHSCEPEERLIWQNLHEGMCGKDGVCSDLKYECEVGNPINQYRVGVHYYWDCEGLSGGNTVNCNFTESSVVTGGTSCCPFGYKKQSDNKCHLMRPLCATADGFGSRGCMGNGVSIPRNRSVDYTWPSMLAYDGHDFHGMNLGESTIFSVSDYPPDGGYCGSTIFYDSCITNGTILYHAIDGSDRGYYLKTCADGSLPLTKDECYCSS